MTYKETLDWMFSRLPMYQQQGASAYRKDLTNIKLLAAHLGNPEKQLKCIHIAGTNGKGSTSNMLASILQQAGYKTGLYTSPHLKDYRERVRINGEMISEDYVTAFISRNKVFFEANNLSFFEMTVGLAFQYFADENIDIAIIETGMGGRLDATNILTPVLSVITNIGFDHTQFLGDTLEKIAGEKAGIIKPGVPVVIGEYDEETAAVFRQKAAETNSSIYFASDCDFPEYDSDLKGVYQKHNKRTVLKAVEVLKESLIINEDDIINGLLNVSDNTGFAGRWQKINDKPLAIADTAHNSHGLIEVVRQIELQQYNKLHIVLGVVNDKDLTDILPLFPKKAQYYFCRPDVPRGLDAEILADKAKAFHLHGNIYDSVTAAYQKARSIASPDDFIYVGGSTFVVAEIL
ncbi:bifunctional folylpolyglutamate synthase/dihydrofolate synthase [Flavobacterium sp. J372]|uniref:bifunctional folylpolyglutamate synthase/dihydrofolate synthase n=1 Tax=Flavobacterium sp. J372 TaxID=2898436 RepID=UPI002151C3A6|nr:folylpolyglutamate synthase/dihydrofolate synthase family protein [Flavobacterium sp. J372]MCR5861518.1 bifunctional folylpolyglutamate synthase/dihydrofolate synthase [Flavobacterium sp. J372]